MMWDIYEEHLDEAGWLWAEWESSLDSPVYSITDVAVGPEERLRAHLDGLVLGGARVAEKLLVPALTGDDPGTVAAAAWALAQSEHADHQDKVIDALMVGGPTATAVARALRLAPRADISRLIPRWGEASPTLRGHIIDIFAPREPDWVRQRVQAALLSGKLALVSAGLRAVRSLRDEVFRDHVQLSMQLDDPQGLRAALSAGLCLGLKVSWEVCRMAAEAKDDSCRFALGLLASSADPSDRAAVRAKLADPMVASHALWALGFSGDLEAADLMVEALDRHGKVAGESLSAVTGLVVDGPFRKPGESHGPDEDEVALDDPPPTVRPEDALPEPQVDAIRKWWAQEREHFKPGLRYLYGHPRTPELLSTALLFAPTWRRDIFALELADSRAGVPKLDLYGWAKDQLEQLRPD